MGLSEILVSFEFFLTNLSNEGFATTSGLFVLTDFFVLSCISSLPEVNKRISITSERYLLN